MDKSGKMKELGNKILIKTSGKDNVQLISNEINISVQVPEINPVSTIGAGDGFNAGILYGLLPYLSDPKKNIDLNTDQWLKILNLGIHFSQEVCMSIENYVRIGFNPESNLTS